jgi:hypothetical protein
MRLRRISASSSIARWVVEKDYAFSPRFGDETRFDLPVENRASSVNNRWYIDYVLVSGLMSNRICKKRRFGLGFPAFPIPTSAVL